MLVYFCPLKSILYIAGVSINVVVTDSLLFLLAHSQAANMCYDRFCKDRNPVPLSGPLLECLTQDLQRLKERIVCRRSGSVPPSLEAIGCKVRAHTCLGNP